MKAFAEAGQKVVESMRSNSRENTTVVTISANGATWARTTIFKGQRLQPDWFAERNGPKDARYTCTDTSFMQGDVFIKFLKDFHKQLDDRGVLDGKPHILVLDGHASHVSCEVIKLAMEVNIIHFQLPSHTLRITQLLDVVAFGTFKKEVTKVLQDYYHAGQRLQPDWFAERNGPKDARYTCTDTSFMQGDVFIKFLKDFHKQLDDRGVLDGKPHILVLDGHASHVSCEVIKLAMEVNIIHFQLPSHTLRITQLLDVVAFGTFKKEHDVPGVMAAAWQRSFTPERNKASFAGAGLWPVDMDRALTRLQGKAKRKEGPTGRPPLEDVPIAMTHEQLDEAIGERGLRQLKAGGHAITGLKVGTVMLGGLLT
ncbi:unnamed protein product [Ectocarpus sp. CCAP 1310/34]|nr:unnamed protein product [Ectocarpus sp. CCAP 1310/34]